MERPLNTPCGAHRLLLKPEMASCPWNTTLEQRLFWKISVLTCGSRFAYIGLVVHSFWENG